MHYLGLMQQGMPTEVANDFVNIYEILLVHGAPKGIAEQKVTGLFSPPRITEEIRRVPNLMFEGGSTHEFSFQIKIARPGISGKRPIGEGSLPK